MKSKTITFILFTLLVIGCASPNFMGAETWISEGYYVERWYINPDYNATLPSGTAGYGASAQKLKDKFIIKYYISDDKGSTIEIPKQDIWLIKHNGKRFNKQDDDNLFFYVKNKNRQFVKGYYGISNYTILLPIKKCYKNGFCELYESYNYKNEKVIRYIKQSILLKRLSDK